MALTVKFKKLNPNAKMPVKKYKGDACFDLMAIDIELTDKYIEYKTGIAVEIPDGYVGLAFPRSSITKMDLLLKNSVGVIDSNYRGEVTARFTRIGNGGDIYIPGDRIVQLMIIKNEEIQWIEVDELSFSDRGENGYGSTGK